jgi:hypothetical protein
MKKGFSIIAGILIILLIIIAGAVGFGYYKYTTDPDFDFYGLISRDFFMQVQPNSDLLPESLLPYVKGTDASIILTYKKSDGMNSIIEIMNKSLPEESAALFSFGDIENALIAAKLPESFEGDLNTGAGMYAIELSSEETAKAALERMKEQTPEGTAWVQEGNILYGSFGDEELKGDLRKNLLFANMKTNHKDSEIAFLMNPYENKNLGMELYSALLLFGPALQDMIPSAIEANNGIVQTAHAQFISPTDEPGAITQVTETQGLTDSIKSIIALVFSSSYMGLYGDIEGFNINATLEMQFADFDTHYEVVKISAEAEGIEVSEEDAKKNYEMLTSGINSFINSPAIPEDVDVSFEDLFLSVSISQDIEGFIQAQAEAPARARDAARKNDMYNIVTAVEQYYADNNTNPSKSACVEDIKELKEYFLRGEFPMDTLGEQTFGSNTCENGFYYQVAGEDAYIVWAIMEYEGNGNMNSFESDPAKVKEGQSGNFFALVRGGIKTEDTAEEEPVEKVKRVQD